MDLYVKFPAVQVSDYIRNFEVRGSHVGNAKG